MIDYPMTADKARAATLGYVREMLARGYASADAAREVSAGFGAPGEPGYDIRSGKITVPSFGPDKHTFRFTELEAEIRRARTAEQLTLF